MGNTLENKLEKTGKNSRRSFTGNYLCNVLGDKSKLGIFYQLIRGYLKDREEHYKN